jgi:hypothetical protein
MSLAEKMRARAKARQWIREAGSLGLDDITRRRRLGGDSGAVPTLRPSDMPALEAGSLRALALLRDFQWHAADEIRATAGHPGCPASEGLRRMRELRKVYEVEKRRVHDTRLWEYRLVGLKKQT